MPMEFRAQIRQLSMSTTAGERRRRRWCSTVLQISATILLSLFLPLSFLLLSRLSAALHRHVSNVETHIDFIAFLFLYFNSAVLYFLLSFLAVAAFLRGLTGGRLKLLHLLLCQSPVDVDAVAELDDDRAGCGRRRPRLSVAWLFLCTSVLFAELGVEFQLAGDGEPSPESCRNGFLTGLLFAVGLYETMLYWSESVVEQVVEDVAAAVVAETGIKGEDGGEMKKGRMRALGRAGLGLSFGALWWWRLRDHFDSLAVALPPATDLHYNVVMKMAGFVSVGMHYLTISTGAVRAFAGVAGMMQQLMVRWRRRNGKHTLRAPPIQGNV